MEICANIGGFGGVSMRLMLYVITEYVIRLKVLIEVGLMNINYEALIQLRDLIRGLDFENDLMAFGSKGLGKCYPLPRDTKVISSLFEEMTHQSVIIAYCKKHKIKWKRGSQTKYPDWSFSGSYLGLDIDRWIAVDGKSTYFTKPNTINGLTLGSYQGGLRNPTSKRYTILPYNSYDAHLCLCFIYDRPPEQEMRVVSNVEVYLHPKHKIAAEGLGSGNTKNIGSPKDINVIRNGTGPFANYGHSVFESYWRAYPTYKSISNYLMENNVA
jgi:hypothetical protein